MRRGGQGQAPPQRAPPNFTPLRLPLAGADRLGVRLGGLLRALGRRGSAWIGSIAIACSLRCSRPARSRAPRNAWRRVRARPEAISKLESELGAQLLNRTTRAISPTEVGRAYYERIEDFIEEFDALRPRCAARRKIGRDIYFKTDARAEAGLLDLEIVAHDFELLAERDEAALIGVQREAE